MNRILTICILLLVASVGIMAQACDHTSNSAERFENMRILPPVQIISFERKTVVYTFSDKYTVYTGAFDVTDDTELDPAFAAEYKKGFWWILYCVKDRHLYVVRRMDPKRMQHKKVT